MSEGHPDGEVKTAAAAARPSRGQRLLAVVLWCAAGALILFLAAWAALQHTYGTGFFSARSAGKTAGLLAAALFMIQFALSARIKALDRVFGLDRLLRAHKYTGATAVVLALLHPLLIYAKRAGAPAALTWALWPETVGAIALLLALVIVATSIWRAFLEISFEAWRGIHQVTFAIVAAVAVHSLVLGSDLRRGWALVFWWALLACYAALFVWVRFVKPARLKKRAHTVAAVTRVSHDTWNIELAPPDDVAFEYLPGQFAFLRLFGQDVKSEEHPFTISSSPARREGISFTIKESGDFTATVGRLRPGGKAWVDGPYGRFTHLARAREDLLMIAGGVGITPILSMLRYMADTGGGPAVTLIWGNKAEGDMLFRDEIESFRGTIKDFRVHHVMSGQDDWPGEKGYIDEKMLARLLSEEELARRVFLCGPPVMMALVSRALARLGVPHSRVHTERFAL